MNFEELLAHLGENYAGVELYSVEDRDMTDHETTIQYFMKKEEAIARAEQIWDGISADDRDYREISVHRGEIEHNAQFDRYRFIVLQKLYKAYKKIYVTEAFARQFRQQRKETHLAAGMSEDEAIAQAKQDFNAQYAVQPEVKFGMFAGYDYAPAGQTC